jgi:hypothetical protein
MWGAEPKETTRSGIAHVEFNGAAAGDKTALFWEQVKEKQSKSEQFYTDGNLTRN